MTSASVATGTSQASTPAPRGITTSDGGACAVPADACSAIARAWSAGSRGSVSTVSPGKTRPRTPVTRPSRSTKTREASRTGTSPTAWVAFVVTMPGTVTVSGSPSRSTVESTPNRSGP